MAGLMTDEDSNLSFRDLAVKRCLLDPKTKGFCAWVYRWFTAMTIKRLMLTKNWDETKDAIAEWRAMDAGLGPAVLARSLDDGIKADVAQIKDVMEMLKDKQKAKEIK